MEEIKFKFYDRVLIKENCPFSEYRNLTGIVLDQSSTYVKIKLRDHIPENKFHLVKNPIWLQPDEIRVIDSRRIRSLTKFTLNFFKIHKKNFIDNYGMYMYKCLRSAAKISGSLSFTEIDLICTTISCESFISN